MKPILAVLLVFAFSNVSNLQAADGVLPLVGDGKWYSVQYATAPDANPGLPSIVQFTSHVTGSWYMVRRFSEDAEFLFNADHAVALKEEKEEPVRRRKRVLTARPVETDAAPAADATNMPESAPPTETPAP